jgi:hypothetical protein
MDLKLSQDDLIHQLKGVTSDRGNNNADQQTVHMLMCAVHSLNNLFQAPKYDKLLFDYAADLLLRINERRILDDADVEGDGENGERDPYSTMEIDYNFDVIQQVLLGSGYSLQFVTSNDIGTLGSNPHHAFLVSTEQTCKHFYAVRTLNGWFWNLNSFSKRPTQMTTEQVTDLCQTAIDMRGEGLKVWRLTPSPPTNAIPTVLKSSVKTLGWTDEMLNNQYWWSASFLEELERNELDTSKSDTPEEPGLTCTLAV